MLKIVIKIALLIAIFISFSSCGYKSSAKFAREIVGEKVSTTVIISSTDPENTVLIKDALDKAILEVFHSSLTSRQLSQTHLQISLVKIHYSPIQYDIYGYIIGYRATIVLKIEKNRKKEYITKGSYDFSIVANAVMTDKERFDAINRSSIKAIKSFVAKVSAEGAINQKDK